MALFFPKLFCGKNAELLSKKKITISDSEVIAENNCFIVEDIIGYGYDIKLKTRPEVEIRVMNSQMQEYFNLVEQGDWSFLELDKIPTNKYVELIKDYSINKKCNFIKGEKFYFIKDGNYYNLYDINDCQKVLRVDEDEFKIFFI